MCSCASPRATPPPKSACAKRIVSTLARRAFRRAVTDADLEAPLRFYEEARADGRLRGRHRDGRPRRARQHRVPVPHRARSEERRAAARRIASATSSSPRACRSSCGAASRTMSCSTWRSHGRLSQPAVLERQVKRMLADPRVRGAGHQLREPVAVPAQPRRGESRRAPVPRLRRQPAPGVPPRDRAVLRRASSGKTAACSTCCARTTRSSTSGWPSTTASRTSTAAASGASSLGENSVRGGLLGHGSILTVTSYANRTSPVLRGKWILENILGTPPPPPPANVPPLQDTDAERPRALDARAHGAAPRAVRRARAAIS